ncbi:MAG: ABC transporter ATP-binding protein [Chloroflexota bacterium]|nr:ABC transporter ATP-binding protein [Chloroflexota bacterium]
MATLAARHVSKQYMMGPQITVSALSEVDFHAERGEFVAIMGPSGSGKSTLLHLLGGMDRPTSGEVVLDGQNLSVLGEHALTLLRRRKIGFVFQFFNLIPTLDAEENILLPLLIDGKNRKACMARLDEILYTVGLEQRRHHRPDQLSGGEQQRVAVARALMAEPSLLLADEPTGNLDSAMGLEIIQLLKHLSVTCQQAIVVATHDPRIAEHAHRVVQLSDGKVKAE